MRFPDPPRACSVCGAAPVMVWVPRAVSLECAAGWVQGVCAECALSLWPYGVIPRLVALGEAELVGRISP